MKNKNLTYFLVVAVLGIWGYVFKEVFFAFNAEDNSNWNNMSVIATIQPTKSIDTFSIIANYRDPFLGYYKEPKTRTYTQPRKRVQKKKVVKKKEIPKPIEPKINWNFIQYNGYVYNQSKNKMTALITINGKEYMMSQGDSTKNGITILNLLEDSLQVKYKNKEHYIQKQ